MFSHLSQSLSADQQQRLKYLAVVYWLCAVFVLFFHLKINLLYGVHAYNVVELPLYLLMLLTPLIGRITKSYTITACNLLCTASAQTILYIYAAGAMESPGVFWLIAIPVGGGVILGRKGAFWSALIVAVTIIFFIVAEYSWGATSFIRDLESYHREKKLAFVLFYLFSAWIILYFITKESNAQREIQRRKAEMESLLHILMHDMTNLLSAIEIESYKLRRKPLDHDTEKSVMRIEQSSHEIIGLFNQIREMKALKDGKISVRKDVVNLASVCNKVIDGLARKFSDKEIDVGCGCIIDDAFILGDAALLQSVVLNNLIVNAIKFSPRRTRVDVRLKVDARFVYFEIQDYGIGMPEKIVNNLFDLNYPTTRLGTDGEKGTGYGMPLVKEYVEKMDGQIVVDSTEAGSATSIQGACVTLTFPRHSC